MKYIEVHLQTSLIHRVEDTLPSNLAEAARFIQTDNDLVQVGWWLDPADGSLHEAKTGGTWTREDARQERNKMLANSDFMVLEDSPHYANASDLAAIKTYRQALRDMMSNDPILDATFPSLTLSTDGDSEGPDA